MPDAAEAAIGNYFVLGKAPHRRCTIIQSLYSPDHHTADGVLTSFPFTWRILQKSDLIVKTTDPDTGAVLTLELNSDYIISDGDVNTDNGGQVVFTVIPAEDLEIDFTRHTERTQFTNIEEGFGFSAALVMRSLDRLTMIVQELDNEAASTRVVPVVLAAGVTSAVITHNLDSTTAQIIGFSSTWHTSFRTVSQLANTITIELGSPAPTTTGGTLIAEVRK